ncbi:MAG: hypothetical protein HY040_00825 [Planctomycetes bacterium]|nr:hypothetical protein [Planctomycetota bacterium]
MSNYAGRWFSTFGPMTLEQAGARVQGTYGPADQGTLSGKVEGGRLSFQYEETSERGQGWFGLLRHGRFRGEYQPETAAQAFPWEGQREFEGIWESTFGRLRIIQEEDRVHGFYEGLGGSSIEGRIADGRLEFRYQEPSAAGTGRFELNEGGTSFDGQWQQDGAALAGPWHGRRVFAMPGLTWLVVLEAHWQRSLADNEYAFGFMLREFFARLENVKVRQRFFHDEASLLHWCRELLYLPEPAILMIASHGSPEGLAVHGKIINTRKVLDSLQDVDNIQLLHFSSCLVAQDGDGGSIGNMVQKTSFPISGYATSVDWGASALIEFTYLDLILAKGLAPSHAAAQLGRLLNFAGDSVSPGAPYPPAGFRFFQTAGQVS